MKHNFFKKLTSLLLGIFMVVAMIPAVAIGSNAAESVTLSFTGGTGTSKDSWEFTDASGVSAIFAKNTHNSSPRLDSDCIRFYGTSTMTNSLTVAAPAGYEITGIVFKMNENYKMTAVSADSGSIDTNTFTWSGNASSVVFTTTAQTRFEGATITYTKTTDCEHTNTTAIGEYKAEGCTEDGTTAGVKCADCGYILEPQEAIPAAHKYGTDNVCTVCGDELQIFTLVNDVSELKTGDKIIIVAKDNDFALSDTQNPNNRGQVAINKDGSSVAFVKGVQVITLEAGLVSGTFAFKVESDTVNGYLYAASSSSNHLKTEDALSNNSSWTIEIVDGVVTVAAQGDNERNVLQYNSKSGLFACYSSASQGAISIYKDLSVASPKIESFGLSLNKGVTVNVTYSVSASWLAANSGAKLVFSNGKEANVTAGSNVYSVTLTPGQINSDLTVTLCAADGTALGNAYDVSVTKYSTLVADSNAASMGITDGQYTALVDLLDKIEAYGANTPDAGGASFDGVTDMTVTGSTIISGISGTLSDFATVELNIKNVVDAHTVSITVAGSSILTDAKLADSVNASSQLVIDGIFAANYDDEIVVTVSDETGVVATATLTFNSYLKAVYDLGGEAANVALATYQYGLATVAYDTAS